MPKTDEFYRVMMIVQPGGKPEPWTVYRSLDDAIDAARGLLTSSIAVESEVIWVRKRDDETSVLRLVIDADGKVTKGGRR